MPSRGRTPRTRGVPLLYLFHFSIKGCFGHSRAFHCFNGGYKASYIIPQTDGGTVYMDNYVTAQMLVVKDKGNISELSFSDEHYLDYTYYPFQLDPNESKTNEVGF